MYAWGLHRCSGEESEAVIEAARRSQSDVVVQEELKTMGQTIAESLLAKGEAKGKAEGEAEGRLAALREMLRELLEDRFGALPEDLVQRIEATSDVVRLKSTARQVVRISSLNELSL